MKWLSLGKDSVLSCGVSCVDMLQRGEGEGGEALSSVLGPDLLALQNGLLPGVTVRRTVDLWDSLTFQLSA